MNKKNLKFEMILNKKFSTELSGYNPKEVDQFLDLILTDYKSYEESERVFKEKIADLNAIIDDKDSMIEALKLENDNLKEQTNQLSTGSAPELAKRLLDLERKVSKNLKNKEKK